jgi:diguanylate cyclase (GGDEF)-like protein
VDGSDDHLARAARAYDSGKVDEALAFVDAGLQEATDERERYFLQRAQMLALHRLGKTREAFDLAAELLPRSPAAGASAAVADIAGVMAGLADQLGESALAIERAALALDRLAEVSSDDPGFARASNNLANALLRFGAYHVAAELLSLAAASCAPDHQAFAAIQLNLAVAELGVAEARANGIEPAERSQRLERVVQLSTPFLADLRPRRAVEAATLVAAALLGLDRAEEAEATINAAGSAVARIHDPRAITDLQLVHARTLRTLDRLDEAAAQAQRAVAGAEAADDPVLSAAALRERSHVNEARGDASSALADLHASDALSLHRHSGRYDSLLRQVQHRAALRAARRDAEARASTLEESVASLRELVNHDHLTGLPNRRAFDGDAQRRVRRAGVIMADIDHFKSINDERGHLIGDTVLQVVARTIAGKLRDRGVAYRWGGEEFLIVVDDERAASTPDLAGELRQAVAAAPWFAVAPGLAVTMSVGVAIGSADQLHALVGVADDALYRAKAGGRDQVVVADE